MNLTSKTLSGLLALVLSCGMLADVAFAKRMGGGGSFGGKAGYSRSYTPRQAPSSPTTQPAPAARPLNQQQSMAPGSMPQQQRPSMFSRLGWGLGGFMAGGLLGSMLFGHGGMGWGAGGGIGMLDILLIGLVIFLGYKLLRRRAAAPGAAPTGPVSHDAYDRAEQSWGHLRSREEAASGSNATFSSTGGFGVAPSADAVAGPAVPEGFNVHDFLEGAKTVYARLQHSWDRRDLDDIALFTTAEVLSEIRRQASVDPQPSKTELLLVNAQLVEFREDNQDTVATVLFDVLMREDATEERPKQVREVWHFSRPTADLSANWRLEGIQQLEG